MIRVILESPFAGDINRHIAYGRACLAHSLSLGEAPMAMHLLYTQGGVLDDLNPLDREKGMEAAFSWYGAAQYVVVYRNFGISRGMQAGIDVAGVLGLAVHYRDLNEDQMPWSDRFHAPFPDHRIVTAAKMIEDAGRRR